MQKVNITLNDKICSVDENLTILEAARQHGIKIPTLCHDPRLEPYSSCFVCVVEVQGARSLQTACSTKIMSGMVVNTDSERVRNSRKSALDLLLSNHYADCAAPCKLTCPAGVDVQGYIALIEKGMYKEAVALIKEVNPLPAICGRVCVRPCEVACNRNLMDEGAPVGIDYMKRFASDYDLESGDHFIPDILPPTGKKIAVIGAGPGGLSAAYFLQQKGHQVDIFEANEHAGGWLRYGIPEYRLPNSLLDAEVSTITEIGTKIFYNKNLGQNLLYKEIQDNYDSTILTIGSQKGTLLNVKGEDADGVFSGIDFLRNMEQTGQKYDFSGKVVAVVGAGNTAMDCCRTAVRCGAEKTYIIYRRTEKEAPANPIEIHESTVEGVQYMFLTNPIEVKQDSQGKVKSITCIRMELGEPDSSGRQRPVPVEGSEFELNVDYILAAIGQKTEAAFIEDMNKTTEVGELKLNRWGDIDADKLTLQTGIPSVFAAGDGVTGPATIIEAIAQAGIAARSCLQFISGEKVTPKPKEFLSKKSNFKKLEVKDYKSFFSPQLREEMPVLDSRNRMNFSEVELGYTEESALKEAERCFECGCTEYFSCDLKNYSTEYNVEQKRYSGSYNRYKVDFSHPYIEIDNNKCILCSRCIRICNEVVGANALGLVERGFDTYVAPSMGKSLTMTNCETCGLCISTCPTGAITENVDFKPGPFKLENFQTISNYDSSGEAFAINHKNGFVIKTEGVRGKINKDTNISRKSKFGYKYINDNGRLIKPLLKTEEGFEEIDFEKAYSIIHEQIANSKQERNAFFAGARLSNEEQYLVKKIAADIVKTSAISSFHYLGRYGYEGNSLKNVPFDQIENASKIYVFGNELNYDNGFVNYLVNNAKSKKAVPVEFITNHKTRFDIKADTVKNIDSYYYFVKAVNSYLLQNKLQNKMYIDAQTENFEEYKKNNLNFENYLSKAGISKEELILFAEDFNNQLNAILIYSEKEISGNTSLELINLAAITGKLGKTASGLISLKEKNNSHGLFDNNCNANEDVYLGLKQNKYDNIFIFGEDPIGCAENKDDVNALLSGKFIVVQDYFMTQTAMSADLILPASFPIETGGSYTNTQRVLQNFEAGFDSKVEELNHEQLLGIINKFEKTNLKDLEDIFFEAASNLKQFDSKTKFTVTTQDNHNRMFNFGCDYLELKFETEFAKSF